MVRTLESNSLLVYYLFLYIMLYWNIVMFRLLIFPYHLSGKLRCFYLLRVGHCFIQAFKKTHQFVFVSSLGVCQGDKFLSPEEMFKIRILAYPALQFSIFDQESSKFNPTLLPCSSSAVGVIFLILYIYRV